MRRILRHPILTRGWIQQRQSSTATLTFDTIFSDANKERCKAQLANARPVRDLTWQKKDVPRGAVLVPLCTVDGEPSLLYTLRSSKLLSYRGQVSFPGGKTDEDDDGHTHTALREAEEEVGLQPDDVTVWGEMPQVPGRNYHMIVTPIVAFCGELDIKALKYNKDEVEEVFTRSIRSLCDPQNSGYTSWKEGYTLPVYLGGPHRIWGLTGIITHQLLLALAPGLYTHTFKQHKRVMANVKQDKEEK